MNKNKKAPYYIALFIAACIAFFIIISLVVSFISFFVLMWNQAASFFGYTPWGLFKVISISSICLAIAAVGYKLSK